MVKVPSIEGRKKENDFLNGLGLVSQQALHKENLTILKPMYMNTGYIQFVKKQSALMSMTVGLEERQLS
tara:strand:- start:116 stop:322 length:207 start_codon:yes stop_codon:yes gene_type:complete